VKTEVKDYADEVSGTDSGARTQAHRSGMKQSFVGDSSASSLGRGAAASMAVPPPPPPPAHARIGNMTLNIISAADASARKDRPGLITAWTLGGLRQKKVCSSC